MKPGCNDWNVPDWRDASAYPSPEQPAHVWAWEFLRRNPAYRSDWLSSSIAERSDDISIVDTVRSALSTALEPIAEGSAFSVVASGDVDLALAKWGLAVWHDPRSNKRGEGPYFLARGTQSLPGKGTAYVLERSQLAYVFDLQIPLKKQFDRAFADALAVQEARLKRGEFVAKPSLRLRTDQYATYLRLLDAEADEATRAEIAHTLFASDNDPLKSFDNSKPVARELRDTGFKALAQAS